MQTGCRAGWRRAVGSWPGSAPRPSPGRPAGSNRRGCAPPCPASSHSSSPCPPAPRNPLLLLQAGVVAFKLYPAGATTNSDSGVTDFTKCLPTLRAMAEVCAGVCALVVGRLHTASACSWLPVHCLHTVHNAQCPALHGSSMCCLPALPHTLPACLYLPDKLPALHSTALHCPFSLVARCTQPAERTSIRGPQQPPLPPARPAARSS